MFAFVKSKDFRAELKDFQEKNKKYRIALAKKIVAHKFELDEKLRNIDRDIDLQEYLLELERLESLKPKSSKLKMEVIENEGGD